MADKPLVWLITGVNSGFGTELSLIATKAGHTVVGTVRSASKFPAELEAAGVECAELPLPASEATVKGVVDSVAAKHGRVDVLVNNAGFAHMGVVEEATDAEWRQQFDVNVMSPFQLCRAVLPHMRAAGSGVVVNISSVGGMHAPPGGGLYCSTKFAIEGLSEALAAEVKPFGVRVHVLQPGYFRTNFLASAAAGNRGERRIDAYHSDAAADFGQAHGKQPGDPQKGMQRLFELVTLTGMAQGFADTLWVPIGSDTKLYADMKMDKFNADMEKTRDFAFSTDHDDVKK